MSAKFPSVIRCIKHSSYATLKESGRHQWREKHVPNADKKRLHLNTDLRPVSGSQQLVVAASIASKTNPNCGFVLMDKMEQFDLKTLKEFGKWLDEHDLQVICTRVSTGDECTIVISDGVSEAPVTIKKDNEEGY